MNIGEIERAEGAAAGEAVIVETEEVGNRAAGAANPVTVVAKPVVARKVASELWKGPQVLHHMYYDSVLCNTVEDMQRLLDLGYMLEYKARSDLDKLNAAIADTEDRLADMKQRRDAIVKDAMGSVSRPTVEAKAVIVQAERTSPVVEGPVVVPEEELQAQQPTLWKCEFCGKGNYKTEVALRMHKQQKHPEKCKKPRRGETVEE